MVEVGQHICGAAVQGGAELAELGERGRDAAGDGVDDLVEGAPAGIGVGVAVGGDDVLVDPPRDFDGGMVLHVEQGLGSALLLVGEQ